MERTGEIVSIIRVSRTRWDDMPSGTFASIDGEHYYGIAEHARVGDEFEIVRPGRNFAPMSMTADFIREMVAHNPKAVIEERRGEQMAVRHIRG